MAVLVPDLLEREVFVCGPVGFREAAVAMALELGVPRERILLESFVFGEAVRVPDVPAGTDAGAVDAPQTVTGTADGVPAGTPGGASGDGIAGGQGTSAAVYSVELRGVGRTATCPAGSTILAAAREAGIAHPSSCSEGVCGTCKIAKLSGEIDMDHQGGTRPREVREGKILPCCSVPTTDVVLE